MKGILMKPDMIRAIVDGRKTVTRRLLNPQPFMERGVLRWQPKRTNGYQGMHKPDINMDDHSDLAKIFADYQVGEVVYLKEAWQVLDMDTRTLCEPIHRVKIEYKLDGFITWTKMPATISYTIPDKWHSPLHLAEITARYFIKIAGVKAEWVQEIAWYDIHKEGIQDDTWSIGQNRFVKKTPKRLISDFKHLWDSINKDYPFESNPYIFCYEFALAPRGQLSR